MKYALANENDPAVTSSSIGVGLLSYIRSYTIDITCLDLELFVQVYIQRRFLLSSH